MDINAYLKEKKALIEDWLEKHTPPTNAPPSTIHQAMRYSLLAGGKRLRPVLTLATTESLGGDIRQALPFACALEFIHTYSLIHDDLPAMDNDDFRRGQPSSHKAFGEAVAILAGDALLTQAFSLMSASAQGPSPVAAHIVLQIIQEIAEAAGTQGMIGGQVMDVEFEGRTVTLSQVKAIHRRKTGAIILTAVRVGGLLVGASREQMEDLTQYGQHIGLAFQVVDDVLNIEGKPELLGKTVGSDYSAQKATFPSVLGLEEAKNRARQHYELAIQSLKKFDDQAQILRDLARFVICREF